MTRNKNLFSWFFSCRKLLLHRCAFVSHVLGHSDLSDDPILKPYCHWQNLYLESWLNFEILVPESDSGCRLQLVVKHTVCFTYCKRYRVLLAKQPGHQHLKLASLQCPSLTSIKLINVRMIFNLTFNARLTNAIIMSCNQQCSLPAYSDVRVFHNIMKWWLIF